MTKDPRDTDKSDIMPEPVPGAEMPTPVLGTEPAVAGAVSAARMSAGPKGPDMPKGGMREPGGGHGMPVGSMRQPVSRTPMPSGVMADDGGAPDSRRFGPTDSPPDEPTTSRWEPGVVEVQFAEGVAPEVAESATSPAGALRSSTGADLTDFVRIVQNHGLSQAESTFQTPAQEADAVQESARLQGEDLPNLRSFVTLHFADRADTPSIARELEELDVVVRAVPVPMASPPRTPLDEPLVGTNDQVIGRAVPVPTPRPPLPLDEPLVGTSDQVIVDPGTGLQNQWYVFRCRADRAWSVSSGGGVIVADIDWGYRTTHQDLASQLTMPVQLKEAEPGGDGGRGDARAMGAAASRNAGQGWRKHHGPGGRRSARRSARGVEADLPRSVAHRGSYFYDANLHGLDAVAMEKKHEPYVETLPSRDDLNYIPPGNAGRPDGESSARRRWHRPVEPAPRQQAKKNSRADFPGKADSRENLMGYALSQGADFEIEFPSGG